MQTFLSDIFPKIQRYSQKLDNLTTLTNQHWVSIDKIAANKTVYIFRSNNELLISTNGKVEKAKWEYLGNKSLLIDKSDASYLFKHGFFDDVIMALKVDSSEEYAVFVNENKYNGDLNSIYKVVDFLKEKYISDNVKFDSENRTQYRTNQKFKNNSDHDPITTKISAEEQIQLDLETNKDFKKIIIGILLFLVIVITFFLVGISKK